MRISTSCPELVRVNCVDHLTAAELAPVTVDGGLLTLDVPGETLSERLESLNSMDAHLGGLIADSDDGDEIAALGELKATLGQLVAVVTRESVYTSAAENTVEEATTDLDISHLHAEQHTSIEDSSEQHTADPVNEETENEQAQPETSRRFGR